VGDVVKTANYILGRTPKTPFNVRLADANNDGAVDAADLVEEVRLITGGPRQAPRRVTRRHEAIPPPGGCGGLNTDVLTLEWRSAGDMAICLQNATAYTAFQLTLSLPEGVTADDVRLTAARRSNLQLATGQLPDGRLRVLAYSMDNSPINGNEGALVELQTIGTLQGEAIVDDILFVTPQGDIHAFAPLAISLADGIATTKAVTRGDGAVYDLAGRKPLLPMKRRIYIINGKKILRK